uniref:(California timema) hypothetical protein n=1 Tax=Timema californicum TaxID=61474 RepID=A0A7R9PB23_TIMCA|nr:unnamed protein product [Timema californicum]
MNGHATPLDRFANPPTTTTSETLSTPPPPFPLPHVDRQIEPCGHVVQHEGLAIDRIADDVQWTLTKQIETKQQDYHRISAV